MSDATPLRKDNGSSWPVKLQGRRPSKKLHIGNDLEAEVDNELLKIPRSDNSCTPNADLQSVCQAVTPTCGKDVRSAPSSDCRMSHTHD
ncbi:hypothetical protein EVAR_31835_1 [Eumeta japonica]|uniref:Uncharacterized protein n=1 Tax=Eumeta variegata TaxID=151549 RepID=A0A4C1WIR4_EUMVA|nr:hypothetical protein EVAR_31835_1 [Eumeta japonica]